MIDPFISHELYLIYDPSTALGKKTHAIASSMSEVIHEIDVKSQAITPLRWKEILDMLFMEPMQLINHDHENYAKVIGNDSYSEKDALEILTKNPELLRGPIGVLQNKAVLCIDPKDILKIAAPGAHKE